jgi:hypothetical protein
MAAAAVSENPSMEWIPRLLSRAYNKDEFKEINDMNIVEYGKQNRVLNLKSTETTLEEITDEFVHILALQTAVMLSEPKALPLLKQISWQDSESNTDREFSYIASILCMMSFYVLRRSMRILENINLITKGPDINLIFYKRIDETMFMVSKKIELKSAKGNRCNGSTTGKLDVNQPLLFCKRPSDTEDPNAYEIRYGQYYEAMYVSPSELFQDRTPRTPLLFERLKPLAQTIAQPITLEHKQNDEWIDRFSIAAVYRIAHKDLHLISWQDDLTRDIFLHATDGIETIEQLHALREKVLAERDATAEVVQVRPVFHEFLEFIASRKKGKVSSKKK